MPSSLLRYGLIALTILAGFVPKARAQFPDSWTGSAIGSSSPCSFDATSGNITGGGADIGGTSDQFEFVSLAFAGDGTLVAQVASLIGTPLSPSDSAGSLPDSAGIRSHPHLLVAAGKDGTIFLLDPDNMGKFGPTDNVVQEWGRPSTTGIDCSFGTPAFFNCTVYYFPGYGGYGRSRKP